MTTQPYMHGFKLYYASDPKLYASCLKLHQSVQAVQALCMRPIQNQNFHASGQTQLLLVNELMSRSQSDRKLELGTSLLVTELHARRLCVSLEMVDYYGCVCMTIIIQNNAVLTT